LSFLNDNLVLDIYQPNVFKELAHLVGGQGLGKAVGDHIVGGRVDHPDLPALYFLSQPVVVDINVSEFSRQLGGVLIDQPDRLFVVALDRDRRILKPNT
jgi:hypothetical protein